MLATVGIFIISGLVLQQGEALAAIRSTTALVYGLAAILLITPLLSLAMLRLPLQVCVWWGSQARCCGTSGCLLPPAAVSLMILLTCLGQASVRAPRTLCVVVRRVGSQTIAPTASVPLPVQPSEMAVGLAIYCCMPTSLSTNIALTQVSSARASASAWRHILACQALLLPLALLRCENCTGLNHALPACALPPTRACLATHTPPWTPPPFQACGGNSAVSLLLTVASNLLSVATVPLVLSRVLAAAGAGVGLPGFSAGGLFRSLLVTVLAPLLAGVAVQTWVPGG